MKITSDKRHAGLSLAGALTLTLGFASIPYAPVEAQTPAKAPGNGKAWVVPRTLDGKPDLQGNWSNETQTPFERMGNQGPTLTEAQAAALEKRAHDVEEFRDRPSDPNEKVTKPVGNELADVAGDPTFVERIAQAAGGNVGGYNGFWLDPGHKVVRIDGVPRSSIVIDPPNGRVPPLTVAGKQLAAERSAQARKFGQLDGPELASLSDRCLTSFGSNAGPPMLPNYFYNNNYTIVQTKDHVMIMTEMVHDARIIRLGATEHLPSQFRPWFGDSIGRWEGDTLVVETININPEQTASSGGLGPYRAASDELKVTERFTRTGPDVIVYKFTVEDPTSLTAPYSGELPFNRINEGVFEYACAEGNYALQSMLAGAREEERVKAEQKK